MLWPIPLNMEGRKIMLVKHIPIIRTVRMTLVLLPR
jgi:hypothetical protein